MYKLIANMILNTSDIEKEIIISRTICTSDIMDDIYNAVSNYKHSLLTSKIHHPEYGIAKPVQVNEYSPKEDGILALRDDEVLPFANYLYMAASKTGKKPINIAQLNLVLIKETFQNKMEE